MKEYLAIKVVFHYRNLVYTKDDGVKKVVMVSRLVRK